MTPLAANRAPSSLMRVTPEARVGADVIDHGGVGAQTGLQPVVQPFGERLLLNGFPIAGHDGLNVGRGVVEC